MRTARSMIRVATLAAYRAKHARICRENELRPVTDPDTVLEAYINHGRCVADCPECRGGIAIQPEWPEAGCPDCGTWYLNIALPSQLDEIQEVLSVRKAVNQNWLVGETVERLRFENELFAHELRAPERLRQRGAQ